MNSAALPPTSNTGGGSAPWPVSMRTMFEDSATAFEFEFGDVAFVSGVNVMSSFMSAVSACKSIEAMELERGSPFGFSSAPVAPEVSEHQEPARPDALIANLSLLEKIAILGMNSTLSRGIARRVTSLAECQDRPSWKDYGALAGLGLCVKDVESGYHELTDAGRELAPLISARLCQQYDIHIMTQERHTTLTSYGCTCGQWSAQLNGHGMHQTRRAQNSFYRHVPAQCREAESA